MAVRWSSRFEHLLASGDRDGHLLLWDVRRAKNCLRYFDFNCISKASDKDYHSTSHKRKSSAVLPSAGLHKKGQSTMPKENGTRENLKLSKKPITEHLNSTSNIPIAHNGAVNGILFCDDGKHLLSYGCHDGRIRKWDTLSGINKKIKFPKLPPNKNSPNMCMKFDRTSGLVPSPGLIFVPSEDTIVVFDVENGERLQTLNGHFYGVNCCIFNPYAQELISGGSDRNILIWESNQSQADAYLDHLKNSSTGNNKDISNNDTSLNLVTRDDWSSSDDETDEDPCD